MPTEYDHFMITPYSCLLTLHFPSSLSDNRIWHWKKTVGWSANLNTWRKVGECTKRAQVMTVFLLTFNEINMIIHQVLNQRVKVVLRSVGPCTRDCLGDTCKDDLDTMNSELQCTPIRSPVHSSWIVTLFVYFAFTSARSRCFQVFPVLSGTIHTRLCFSYMEALLVHCASVFIQ